MIIKGDSIIELKKLEENSVDAIVTDPPYGLSFMGKKWDYDVPSVELWKEAFRVLKPGGFILSFAGTRTYHRMAVNIEDAGFEIRDMISWLYGSGFPKSLNIGKQVDKIQGNEREVVGVSEGKGYSSIQEKNIEHNNRPYVKGLPYEKADRTLTKGTSEWEGWGTALKPACEPIVVARKPLSEKNVALNVLKWGTGGINIDACRIGTDIIPAQKRGNSINTDFMSGGFTPERQGRFPANIILDEEAGKLLDEQSGISQTTSTKLGGNKDFSGITSYKGSGEVTIRHNDKGGASRFFYCAKASKSERNKGCDNLEEHKIHTFATANGTSGKPSSISEGRNTIYRNNHPTVKPIKLMEYLIKLVSKEEAVVLDMFMGSGTTGIACKNLNRKFIGIEREEDYIKIAEARLK